MRKIIETAWRLLAIWPWPSGPYRLWGIRLAAAAMAATIQPTAGMTQAWDRGRALIDAAANPRPYRHNGEQLRPSDVSHVLRDWGLRLLSGPIRSATGYQAIVRDDAGQDLFVKVDPYDGAILSLELTDKVGTGLFSFVPSIASGRADERLGSEDIRPPPRPGKSPTLLSQGQRKAGGAVRVLSPLATRKARGTDRTSSRRLATVEPSVEAPTRKRATVTPSVSRVPKSYARPHSIGPVPGPRTPPKTGAGGSEVLTTSPAVGKDAAGPASAPQAAPPAVGKDAAGPASAPQAAPSVSATPKSEKQSTKPQMPVDAGFD